MTMMMMMMMLLFLNRFVPSVITFTLPYLTLPSGWMPARQTPSAEATARAQCASPTDLKVKRRLQNKTSHGDDSVAAAVILSALFLLLRDSS